MILYFISFFVLYTVYRLEHVKDGSPSMDVTVPWNGDGPCQSFHMLKNSVLTTYRQNVINPGPPSTCISTISFNSSQGNRIAKADVLSQFIVGNQHQRICRDKLINIHGGLVAACSNQQGKKSIVT